MHGASCSLILQPYSRSLPSGAPGEDFSTRKTGLGIYEPGDSAGDSAVSAGDSVVPASESVVAAGDSVVVAGLVTAVAAGGVVGAGVAAGSIVSVFCSHAARSAALARMQIYFFIMLVWNGTLL
jgi:hypothetical protein